MIKSTTPADGVIPYWDNILGIHSLQPAIIRELDRQFKVTYCGGYPMALLLAPRKESDPTALQSGFYHDLDIYAEDDTQLTAVRQWLDKCAGEDPKHKVVKTDNASSYTMVTEKGPISLQLITKFTGRPDKVLETFDFVNCAIGFAPHNKTIYYHKDALSFHKHEQLEILDPWMLKETSDEAEKYVIIQLIRFKKYCWRWGYTLGPKAFKLLFEMYLKRPHLVVKQNAIFGAGSGNLPHVARRGFNLWTEMACLFKQTKWWRDSLDPYGYIKNGSESFEAEDPIVPLNATFDEAFNFAKEFEAQKETIEKNLGAYKTPRKLGSGWPKTDGVSPSSHSTQIYGPGNKIPQVKQQHEYDLSELQKHLGEVWNPSVDALLRADAVRIFGLDSPDNVEIYFDKATGKANVTVIETQPTPVTPTPVPPITVYSSGGPIGQLKSFNASPARPAVEVTPVKPAYTGYKSYKNR